MVLNSIIELWKNEKLFRIYVLLLCFAYIKQLISPQALVDTAEYQNAATNFLKALNFDSCIGANCDHILHETRRTVGYPIMLVITGSLYPVLFFLQLLGAVFIPVLGKKLLHEMNISESVFRIFILFLLLYPLQFFYTVLPMPEIWCQLLLMLFLLFFYQKKWWQAGVFLSLLLLLKPVFLLLVILAIIPFLRSPLTRWGLLLPWMPFLAISAWNSQQTGKFHYTSMGVENAWEYNQRAVLNKVMTETERNHYYRKHDSIFESISFREKYVLMQNEVRRNVMNHWKLYSLLHIQGSLLACVDPGRYDLVAFWGMGEGKGFMTAKAGGNRWDRLRAQPIEIWIYMGFFLLVNLVKIFFALWAVYRRYSVWLGIFGMVAIFIAVTGPVGSARYLYPFMPLICMMAGHGWFLWRNRNEKNIAAQR